MGINWQRLVHDAREEAGELADKSESYQRAVAKYREAEERVKEALPDHFSTLIVDLLDAAGEMDAEFEHALYRVGMQHGYEFARCIHPSESTNPLPTTSSEQSQIEISVLELMGVMSERIDGSLQHDHKLLEAKQHVSDAYDAVEQQLPEQKALLRKLSDACTVLEEEIARAYYAVGLRHGDDLRKLLSPISYLRNTNRF